MTNARKLFTALFFAILPLAAEAAHQDLPMHGHEEELVEHHHAGKCPIISG